MSDDDDRDGKEPELFKGVDWEPLAHLANELHGETDRAAIVLGAAMLHDSLRTMLQRYLRPAVNKQAAADIDKDELLGRDRALSTFSACITACYRLGLIDRAVYTSLEAVRKIRNDFSHLVVTPNLNHDPYRSWIALLDTEWGEQTEIWTGILNKHYKGESSPRTQLRLSLTFLTFWLAGISQLITPVETLIEE